MKFDFDTPIDRRGTYSYKWDNKDCVLPMWVADMDFKTAPAVVEALTRRAEHGIFGYSYVPDKLYTAVSEFWSKRHGWRPDEGDMVYSSGVVAAISSLVRKLTSVAEGVLIQAPVYNIFYNSILNNGRRVISSDLLLRDGRYEIDFDDLEKKMSDPQTTLYILCNPHNPVGKTFTRQELYKIGELAKAHGVTVISDEIHCEFTEPKCAYTPFASVSEDCRDNSVTLLSLSKSFNIAGLTSAFAVVHNPHLRAKVYRGLNTDEVGEPNAFAVQANLAALTEGEQWLDELVDYINENRRIAREYVLSNIPELSLPYSDCTYLLWADISALGIDSVSFADELLKCSGLYINDGLEYGECGRYFIRINLATTRENVLRGMELLREGISKIKAKK